MRVKEAKGLAILDKQPTQIHASPDLNLSPLYLTRLALCKSFYLEKKVVF